MFTFFKEAYKHLSLYIKEAACVFNWSHYENVIQEIHCLTILSQASNTYGMIIAETFCDALIQIEIRTE
jgi:hypothetical protein